VRHVLTRLGGAWRVLSIVGGLAPGRVLDALYDAVARVRARLFAAPPDVCPIVPPHVKHRFRN
jgi:predicted DCC family thiol-disulfide oxidoreductase YuxK